MHENFSRETLLQILVQKEEGSRAWVDRQSPQFPPKHSTHQPNWSNSYAQPTGACFFIWIHHEMQINSRHSKPIDWGWQWSTISVQIRNKGLLKLLKLGKASDCRMTTLIEDILSLKSLFRMCSFCLDNDDDNIDCNSVSSYAQGILLDEEFLVPPCSWTRCV